MNEVPGLVSSGEYHRIIVLDRQGGGGRYMFLIVAQTAQIRVSQCYKDVTNHKVRQYLLLVPLSLVLCSSLHASTIY